MLKNMPTSGYQYKVKRGDSLNKIEKAAFGFITGILETANPQIVGRVISLENRPTIYAGDILNIPPNIEKEKLKTELSQLKISGKDLEEITIKIEDLELKYIAVRVWKTMDNVADGATVSIQWTPGFDKKKDSLLVPFTFPKAQIYMGNDLILSGILYGVSPKKTKTGTTADLEIWTYAADIIDSTMPEPYEARKITLEDRANNILRHIGIKAIFNFPSGGAFDRVTGEMTESIFSHLSSLASQRGLLMNSNPQGDIVFTKTTESETVGTLEVKSTDVLSWGANFDGRKLYNKIRAIGQSPGNANKETISIDNNIPRSRFITIRADEATDGNLQKAADWKRTKQYADALTISIPVKGFYNPKGKRWEENTKVTIKSQELFIPNGFDFLIRNVEFNSESSGKTATLSLVPPTVFTGEDLILPWEVTA